MEDRGEQLTTVLTEAPALTRESTTSEWPLRAARWSADILGRERRNISGQDDVNLMVT